MELLIHPIFLALYGWLVYNVIVFSIRKETYDKGCDAKFKIKSFINQHWDNWLATLLLTPIVAYCGPEVLDIINQYLEKSYEWNVAYYFGTGILGELIYILIRKLLK